MTSRTCYDKDSDSRDRRTPRHVITVVYDDNKDNLEDILRKAGRLLPDRKVKEVCQTSGEVLVSANARTKTVG